MYGFSNKNLQIIIAFAWFLSASNRPNNWSIFTAHLLTAKNYHEAVEILRDAGVGCADGISVNMRFIGPRNYSDNFYNVEVAPAIDNESQIDGIEITGDGCFIHSNIYLRIKIEECDDLPMKATKARFSTLLNFPSPKCKKDIANMLGDTSHPEYWVFRCKKEYDMRTVCVGMFDFIRRTWSLYKGNPKNSQPIAVLHLDIDE